MGDAPGAIRLSSGIGLDAAAIERRVPSRLAAEHLVAELTLVMLRHGVRAALALLNARTRYRFTGLYRVEAPLLRNIHLYDRENPSLSLSGDIDMREETHCAFCGPAGYRPAPTIARTDARPWAVPARGAILSLVGVPLRGADGRVRGTLCHFDCRPRLTPVGEREFLARVAALLIGDWLDGAARDGERVNSGDDLTDPRPK